MHITTHNTPIHTLIQHTSITYNFFSREFFQTHKNECGSPDSIANAAKMWKNICEEEKQKYQDLSDKDKLRYDSEIQEYKKKFTDHDLPIMDSKRDKQRFLYQCVMKEDIISLARFIQLLNVQAWEGSDG